MRNFVTVPSNLYIHISDLNKLDKGEDVNGYIEVNNPSEYELINKHAFQPAIKVNDNIYNVCYIFK